MNDPILLRGKKAVAYLRVSTLKQANKENSLPAQLREIEDYAHREGIEIVEVIEERGKSARGGKKRPAFEEAFKRIVNHKIKIDFIIVWELSRFYRDHAEGIYIEYTLKQLGVKVLSAPKTSMAKVLASA